MNTGTVSARGAAAPAIPNRVSREGGTRAGRICAGNSPTRQTPAASHAPDGTVAARESAGADCDSLRLRSLGSGGGRP